MYQLLKRLDKKKKGFAAKVLIALFGVPAWGLVYLIANVFSAIYKIEIEFDVFKYIIVPSIIVLISIIVVFSELHKKLGMSSKIMTYLFIYIHGTWGVVVVSSLPNEYNGFVGLFYTFIGIIFFHSIAGFFVTISFSLYILVVSYLIFKYSMPALGPDDKLYLIFCLFSGAWSGMFNSFSARRKRVLQKLKNEIENAHRKLKKIDKMKSRFFQNISHEIRTPLTLLINPLENALKKYPDEDDLKISSKYSKKLLVLVEQLLDIQKITAEPVDLQGVRLDLMIYLDNIAKYFSSVCRDRKINFIFNDKIKINEKIYLNVEVDAFEKIMFNYLSNALKNTPIRGYIKLTVASDKEKVKIIVEDSGPGVKCDDSTELFDIFTSVQDTKIKGKEMHSLSLALVKELASRMNGSVGCDASDGVIRNYWVEFPKYEAEKPILDILVIDDSETQLEFIESAVLKKINVNNYNLVHDYKSGMELAKNYRIKCVLVDAILKEGSGIDFLKFIEKEQPKCKRLLFTGDTNLDLLDSAINDETIEKVFRKPVDVKKVSKTITEALASSSVKGEEVNEVQDSTLNRWIFDEELVLTEEKPDSEAIKDAPKILVVDDIYEMRSSIEKILYEHEFNVVMASDGEEAYNVAKEYKPDLIITDWMMPKMSGPELIEKMHEDKEVSSIPTILLTAKADDESKIEGYKVGASAYLGKPFDSLELISIVKNLLKLKETERSLDKLNKHLSENILKRYLPPKVVDDVLAGKMQLDETPTMKVVTILFTDICGFTSATSELGPRKMSDIINMYLSEMNKIIFDNSGSVDKFIGDSIMTLFGAPNEMEAEAQVDAAIKCAKDMIHKLDELNTFFRGKGCSDLKIRIGIHHGPAVVGHFGSAVRSDYTALGPTVNMAARVLNVAGPNEIFFTGVVRDLMPSNDEVKWKKAGEYDLRSIGKNIVLFKLNY